MSYKAGSAHISVVPDFSGWHRKSDEFLKSTEPTFAKYGAESGRKFMTGFDASLREKFTHLPKPVIRANADAARADAELDHAARDRKVKLKVEVDKSFLGRIGSMLGGGSGGGSGLGGALAAGGAQPWLLGGAAAAAAALAPAVLPAAAGAGFAALGVIAASKFDKGLASGLTRTKTTFEGVLRDAVQPFGREFAGMLPQVDQWVKSMGPDLKAAFSASTPFLRTFTGVAERFGSALLPSITRMMKQFAPDLPILAEGFSAIGKGVTGFLGAFTSHGMKSAVTDFKGIATLTEYALIGAGKAANFLATGFADAGHIALTWGPKIASGFLTFSELVINGARGLTDAVLSSFKFIVHGAADAFGWLPHLGGQLRSADAAIGNWRKSVDGSFDAAIRKVNSWKSTLDKTPKRLQLQGDISDLSAKLSSAKAQLADKNLTKTRRAAIEANVSQLKGQIQYAKDLLDWINGKTATTYVLTKYYNPPPAGGLKYHAAGTPSAPPGWAWVGERGPELLRFAGGETVLSHAASMQAIRQLAAMRVPAAAAMLPGVSGGAPGGQLAMRVTYDGPGDGAIAAIVRDLRFHIQGTTGGNVQAALGRGSVR